MNEMSFESLMAVGTGLASPESKESKINGVPFDGYNDGVDMDLARTSEQLHFVDTYDKLQSLHSAEKLKMIKKISTAYNVKTIGNANVANSVESFCNNAMSLEGVDVKAVAAKIKAKFIEIFKKIAEFFKNLVIKVLTAKYKGKVAEQIKTTLKIDHEKINVLISTIQSTSDEKITPQYKEVLAMGQKNVEMDRKVCMEILKFLNFAAKVARKTGSDKKTGIDDVVNTDEILNMKLFDYDGVPGGVTMKQWLPKIEEMVNQVSSGKMKDVKDQIIATIKAGATNIDEVKKGVEIADKIGADMLKSLTEANEKLSQTLKEAKNKGKADKAAAASPAPEGQNA